MGSWLDARRHGGLWAVRIDDVDRTRAVTGADATILRSLEAHGLTWDGPSSTRASVTGNSAAACRRLIDAGHAFPCACTRRELRAVAAHGHRRNDPSRHLPRRPPPGRRRASWRMRAADATWSSRTARLGRQRARWPPRSATSLPSWRRPVRLSPGDGGG
ncbi:MAG: glutamate--tRNA ligase family protein [Arhodomonas sp.]|nr:glutamate--tRNA ligase family protein [Arhodomonas sp.]